MVVDSKGTVVASSGVINGQAQKPPQGALDYATAHGQHRVTWQPTATIRQAVVIQPYSHGWVISGRSLREVEVRIGKLSLQLGTAWFITLALSFLFLIPVTYYFHTNFLDPMQMTMFLKNLSIMGGMLLLAAYGPGKYSLDEMLAKKA
jgi:hypothetical protein